jgi:hypothetical protein
MKRILWLLPLCLLAVFASAQENGSQVIGGDEAALREFLRHYMDDYGPFGADSTVVIGVLPQNLPFELPIPDETHIIGSIVGGQDPGIEIIADSELPIHEVVAFYDGVLTEANDWRTLDPVGGFVQEGKLGLFCYGQAGTSLSLIVYPTHPTELRFTIGVAGDMNYCNVPTGMPRDAMTIMPRLVSPQGVVLMSSTGGGGSNGGSAHMWVMLTSALPIDEIAATYQVQFEAAGWQQASREAGENFLWSAWTFTSADGTRWNGTFTLTGMAEGGYTASIIIREAAASSG